MNVLPADVISTMPGRIGTDAAPASATLEVFASPTKSEPDTRHGNDGAIACRNGIAIDRLDSCRGLQPLADRLQSFFNVHNQ